MLRNLYWCRQMANPVFSNAQRQGAMNDRRRAAAADLWRSQFATVFGDDAAGHGLSPDELWELAGAGSELQRYAHNRRARRLDRAVCGSGDHVWRQVSAKVRQTLSVLSAVEAFTADRTKALQWFRDQPLADYGSKTAAQLVRKGHADAVMALLDDAEHGTFA